MLGRSANDQTFATPDQMMVRLAFGPAVVSMRVNRNAPEPIVDQITDRLATVIRAGAPVAGSRLPSIRALARRLGVSTYTVVEVYDRLAALGLTVSRAGLGVFVARHAMLTVEPPAASPLPDAEDAVGLVTALTAGHPTNHAPGSGFLPAAWIEDAWQGSVTGRFHRRLATNIAVASGPQGHAALREQIVARLAGQGIELPPDRVMITQGATQALDLIMRSEFSAGDTVLVEDPGYFMLFPMLDRLGVRQIAVPRLPTGPDLEVVEQACGTHQPKAFFLQPVLHNPTGWTATAGCLHRLLGIAERHDMVLIEDDVYGDLHPDRPVRLAQLAGGEDRVIHVSSFTKLLGPAARVGFVVASKPRIVELLRAKVLSTLTGSALDELLLTEMLASGQHRRYLDRLRPRLAAARALAIRLLTEVGFEIAAAAHGGPFVWAALPNARVTGRLAVEAWQSGILLARGDLFHPDRRASRFLRFNVGRSTDPRLFTELGRLLGQTRLAG